MQTRGREFMRYTYGRARRWFKRCLSRQRRREDRGIVIEALHEMEEERLEMEEEARLDELYEAEMLRIERLVELLELERLQACELLDILEEEGEMREAAMRDALMDDLYYDEAV